MSSTVSIPEESAIILLEAAESLQDDIISGRQWGFDEKAAKENAADLEAAIVELRQEINDQEVTE